MHTTTYTYQQVWASGAARLTCNICNIAKMKEVRDWCTINHFNKNEAGEICSRAEVYEQAKVKVSQEIVRMEAKPFTCTKCRIEHAPAYEHENLTSDDVVRLNEILEVATSLEEQLKVLHKEMNEKFKNKDVMYNDRLCRIDDLNVYQGRLSVCVKKYSKAKTALPGETVSDSDYVGLQWVKLVEENESHTA